MNIIKAKDININKTTALIYGPPGVGKTTTLGQLPGKTLLIDIDHSSDVLKGNENVDIVYTDRNLENLTGIINELMQGHDYDNICIDNLSELQASMLDYLAKTGNNGGMNSQRDYGLVNVKMREYIRDFRAIKGNIIFTAWEVPDKITAPDGSQFVQYVPDLREKIRNNICGLCNVVGRLKQNEEGERIIQLTSTKDTYAKDQINKRKWCRTEEVLI